VLRTGSRRYSHVPKKSYLVTSTLVHRPSGLEKAAGETVTLAELREAGQSDEDIERLLASGALDGSYDGFTPAEQELRSAAEAES